MINKTDIYKYFLITIFISPFLSYFLRVGVIAYGPIIILLLGIIVTEISFLDKMKVLDWGAVFITLPYTIWAGINYIGNPIDGMYITTNFLSIILSPFIVLALIRLRFYSKFFDYKNFVLRSLLIFLILQLIICIGQISTYIFGIGLPIIEEYRAFFMITGTFNNSNDLGSIVLVIVFILSGIEKKYNIKLRFLLWILILTLLIISGSRSALLISSILFFISRGLSLKNLIVLFPFLFLFVYMLYGYSYLNIDNGVFSNFLIRIQSLFNVLESGLSVDSSIKLRLDSYLHFLSNINNIGLGSGELNNYFKYSEGANFNKELIFQNPHSVFVEIGYWLGWPGLCFFSIIFLYLLNFSSRKALLLLVLFVSTSIPSSVLGSLIYFYFLYLMFVFDG